MSLSRGLSLNPCVHSQLAWSALRPRNQDATVGKPQSGAYAAKLHWNGSWKQVSVLQTTFQRL